MDSVTATAREVGVGVSAAPAQTAVSGIRLSIVVTVYSETTSVIETVERLLKLDRGYIAEIIFVVSPRSSRESMDICERLAAQHAPLIRLHIQQQNPGLGWAYREGLALMTGTHVVLMNADLETEPEAVDRMVTRLVETGADGVIANRWLEGGGFENYDPIKYVLNWCFQQIFRVLYMTKLNDLTFGFKLLSRKVVESIQWESTLHEMSIETTVKPLRLGYKLEQVPTRWIGRREGTSKNTFLRNFRYVSVALKVWWRGK